MLTNGCSANLREALGVGRRRRGLALALSERCLPRRDLARPSFFFEMKKIFWLRDLGFRDVNLSFPRIGSAGGLSTAFAEWQFDRDITKCKCRPLPQQSEETSVEAIGRARSAAKEAASFPAL